MEKQSVFELTPRATVMVREQLERILASEIFRGADEQSAFLRAAVEMRLAGEKEITARTISMHLARAYDYFVDFSVRKAAASVRRNLPRYYREAQNDPVIISFPKPRIEDVPADPKTRTPAKRRYIRQHKGEAYRPFLDYNPTALQDRLLTQVMNTLTHGFSKDLLGTIEPLNALMRSDIDNPLFHLLAARVIFDLASLLPFDPIWLQNMALEGVGSSEELAHHILDLANDKVQDALDCDPDMAEAYILRGAIQFRKSNRENAYDAAYDSFIKAVTTDSGEGVTTNPFFLQWLLSHSDPGARATNLHSARKTARERWNDANYQNSYAFVLIEAGEFDEAEKVLTQLLEQPQHRTNPRFHLTLLRLYHLAQRPDDYRRQIHRMRILLPPEDLAWFAGMFPLP
jgi:tetratricopeptide (TPR) repeat protein